MARTAAFLALAIAFVWVLAWAVQRRLIYFPLGEVPSPESVGLTDVQPISFETADGLSLHGWYVPPAHGRSQTTVVVFNGNAGNRAYRAPLARRLADREIGTLLFDYRGYGGNPGSPTETGLTEDARGVRAYLAARPDIDQRRMVYYGESLGAAVALNLAVEHPPHALVLKSPFTSLADVAAHHYPFVPVRWLLRDRYPSIDRILRLRCPVLVISAEHDSIVPSEQSRRLYEAARGPKRLLVLPNTDHNDDELLAGAPVVDAIVDFLRSR